MFSASSSVSAGKRLGYIDIVRAVSILMIVCGHIWPSLPFPGRVYIFMIITGYLWRDGRTVRDEAYRRGKNLIKPYIAWGIILLIILLIYLIYFTNTSWNDILINIITILYGGEKAKAPFTAFWFFTALWFSSVFYRMMRNSSKLIYFSFLVLAAISIVFFGPELAQLPLAVGLGFVSVIFCAAGHWWRQVESRYNPHWSIMLLLFSVTLTIDLSGCIDRIIFKSGSFGTPVLSVANAIVLGLSFITVCRRFAVYVPRKVVDWVNWFVLLTTPVILLHPAVIWVWHLIPGTPNSGPYLFILLFISVSISLMLGWWVRKFVPQRISSWFVPVK